MATNPSTFKYGPDYPVEQTSWQDAKDFCARLNAALPAEAQGKITFRLPTDEEWSIAVGLPEEQGRTPQDKSNKVKNVYPWGTDWPPPKTAGNYADAAYHTHRREQQLTERGIEAPDSVGIFREELCERAGKDNRRTPLAAADAASRYGVGCSA